MSRPRLIALLLVFATLVVYLPVTHHDFLYYDDDEYVVSNHIVQNGLTWAGVKWAFTTGYDSNWHPTTWLSHMLDCELFNLNAGAHHFVNVLFHSANAALLFILLLRLTAKMWPAALVAALFAWHPLHVESVAWVAERKDVLSTFFALLTLLSYATYVSEFPKPKVKVFYAASLIFFALGLMAKPMLVTMPFVLLLLDYWPLQRTAQNKLQAKVGKDFNLENSVFRLHLVEKLPFFFLSSASCVVTLFVQQQSVTSLGQMPLAFRLENASVAVARYLMKTFWPTELAVIYPLAPIPIMTLALSVAGILSVSIAAWHWRKTKPYLLVGWLWFLGTLVPVIGLVHVGSASMADRYTYIPAIGVFIIFAFGLQELSEQLEWPKRFFPTAAIVVSIVCLGLTEEQLLYWRNSETLFHHAIAVTKNNDVAHDNLGLTLELQGRTAEALAEYRAALDINPSHYQLHFAIGNMLEELGKPAEALAEYRQCLERDPKTPALHNAAGRALVALGNPNEAFMEFAEAAQFDPHFAAPHVERAKILLSQAHDVEAVKALWAAAQAEPYNFHTLCTVAHYLAANQNRDGRDGQNALIFALKANDLSASQDPVVFDVLGMAFAETGDFTNALISAKNVLALGETAKMENMEAIRKRMELYENHQPWRESFCVTNAQADLPAK